MHDSCPSPGPTAAIDLGGTIRTVGAEVTLSRARRILHDVGITRIGNVTGLDHVGVPTWMVIGTVVALSFFVVAVNVPTPPRWTVGEVIIT